MQFISAFRHLFFLLSAMLCLHIIGILFFCYVQRSVRLFFIMFLSVLAAVSFLRRCFCRIQRPSRMSCQIEEILSSHFAHSIFSCYTYKSSIFVLYDCCCCCCCFKLCCSHGCVFVIISFDVFIVIGKNASANMIQHEQKSMYANK